MRAMGRSWVAGEDIVEGGEISGRERGRAGSNVSSLMEVDRDVLSMGWGCCVCFGEGMEGQGWSMDRARMMGAVSVLG